jgi:hypothetical protein
MSRPFITAHVQRFRETWNIFHLLEAVRLVLAQQRTLELLYGGYCGLFYRPSPVVASADSVALIPLLKEKIHFPAEGRMSRARLIELFGGSFRVELLPPDFRSARWESVWKEDGWLIIGEYGENSRIALVTAESCVMSEYYRNGPGVRHIHSIQRYGEHGEFLVTTGDSSKFLDQWVVRAGELHFVKRLSKRLAGYTAAVEINGEYYFGTDFSSRPNWIQTLGGRRYFFPEKAYKLNVAEFQVILDRYLVAFNSELRVVGGRQTLSVFDTVEERFIYCEYWTPVESPSSCLTEANPVSSFAGLPRNGASRT